MAFAVEQPADPSLSGTRPFQQDKTVYSPRGPDDNDGAPPPAVSVEEVLDAIGNGPFQRRLLVITGGTQLADAMELILISFLSTGVQCEWGIDDSTKSLISTVVFVGMLVGAIGAGRVSDVLGRRQGYLATTTLCGVCGVLTAFAPDIYSLLVLRGLVGIGIGGAAAGLSLYAEFLPRNMRGRRLIYFFAFFSVGALFEAALAWATLPTHYGWRALLLASSVPSVLLMAAYPLVPESPRLLLLQGKHDEARAVLDTVAAVNGCDLTLLNMHGPLVLHASHGDDEPSPDSPRSAETEPLHKQRVQKSTTTASQRDSPNDEVAVNHGNEADWRGLFAPQLRRTTMVLCVLFFLMAFIYYALVLLTVDLVKTSKEDGHPCAPLTNADYLSIMFANAAELPGLLAAAILLDRCGRKATIAGFFLTSAVLITLLAVPALHRFGVVIVFLARASALGFNQSLWVTTSEAYPTSLRATGLGFTTAFARIGGILTALVSTSLFASDRILCLAISALGCVLAAGLVSFLPLDTMARSLPDRIVLRRYE